MSGDSEPRRRRMPWFKCYPDRWLLDARLNKVSWEAQGMWTRLVMLAARSDEFGVVSLTPGDAPTDVELANEIRADVRKFKRCLAELEAAKVFSRDVAGRIYCKRMIEDAAEQERDTKNGHKGGNPKLVGGLRDISGTDNPHLSNSYETSSEEITPKSEAKDNDYNAVEENGVNPPLKARTKILEEEKKKESSLRSLSVRASAKPKSDPVGFDAFWQAYPRRVAKEDARKAFAAAIKRGADAETIIAAVSRQAWPDDLQFAPYPATWLNKGHWENDPDATARSASVARFAPRRETYEEECRRKLGLRSILDYIDDQPLASEDEDNAKPARLLRIV